MKSIIIKILSSFVFVIYVQLAIAQPPSNYIDIKDSKLGILLILSFIIVFLLMIIGYSYLKFKQAMKDKKLIKSKGTEGFFQNLTLKQIGNFLKQKDTNEDKTSTIKKNIVSIISTFFISQVAIAQNTHTTPNSLISQPGIIITIFLLLLPILFAAILMINKARNSIKRVSNDEKIKQAAVLLQQLKASNSPALQEELLQRKEALNFTLSDIELSGTEKELDERGIIKNVNDQHQIHFTAVKKRASQKPSLDPAISKLIIWYLGCATFWLLVGTGIGEYVGIKFIVPDADHISWLSFGRLRPVHTNIVFWGWASLGILGLGHYVVPIVSNTKLYSVKWGWTALVLTNLMVTLGTISLMSGINNGGGEFREYIWPIMALFAVALILTLINFILTVSNRTTNEIYISNWYIIGALIFTIIVALTAYLPFWQHGLGETIIQGYYMHSGVGMWFTLFTLGLLYYFIPQQLNKPIYAYSLGILAFWTQILFYTIIGTHHFVFSAIPWWLQTVSIVGSAGMIIPVVAGSINFFMTFKGQSSKVETSYTLPFFLTAVLYYFIISMQGTAQAFRFTNLLWHFTDFTVAHSHLGFYGIITFAIWGGAYTIIPRLTGKEPPQHLVGVHFWMAFIGLLLYAVPLMYGATLKGLMWQSGQPFIDSVVLMFDYWIWRAIGGSLMFISHIIFCYNFYKMTFKEVKEIDLQEETFSQLEKELLEIKN